MSLPKYRPPSAAASVFRGVPGASAACAVLPIASVAMAATVAVTAPAANIRRRDARPGDLVASGAGRDCHIFMTSSSSKVIGESCDNYEGLKDVIQLTARGCAVLYAKMLVIQLRKCFEDVENFETFQFQSLQQQESFGTPGQRGNCGAGGQPPAVAPARAGIDNAGFLRDRHPGPVIDAPNSRRHGGVPAPRWTMRFTMKRSLLRPATLATAVAFILVAGALQLRAGLGRPVRPVRPGTAAAGGPGAASTSTWPARTASAPPQHHLEGLVHGRQRRAVRRLRATIDNTNVQTLQYVVTDGTRSPTCRPAT